MAYKMTDVHPQVRVGINRKGEVNIEVASSPDHADPHVDIAEVFVPADAVAALAKFLQTIAH